MKILAELLSKNGTFCTLYGKNGTRTKKRDCPVKYGTVGRPVLNRQTPIGRLRIGLVGIWALRVRMKSQMSSVSLQLSLFKKVVTCVYHDNISLTEYDFQCFKKFFCKHSSQKRSPRSYRLVGSCKLLKMCKSPTPGPNAQCLPNTS